MILRIRAVIYKGSWHRPVKNQWFFNDFAHPGCYLQGIVASTLKNKWFFNDFAHPGCYSKVDRGIIIIIKSNLNFTSQSVNRNVIIIGHHKHYHEQYLDLYNRYHWSCLLFPLSPPSWSSWWSWPDYDHESNHQSSSLAIVTLQSTPSMPKTVLKLARLEKTIPTTPSIRCGGWSRIDFE